MNFASLDEAFGPSTQPNAHLSLCVTYYDNPELAGATFRPEVYQRDVGALTTFGFTPDDEVITLEGSDQWKEAYFEIPEIKFNGVNQGPQAAARFVLSDKIHFTRIRYGEYYALAALLPASTRWRIATARGSTSCSHWMIPAPSPCSGLATPRLSH